MRADAGAIVDELRHELRAAGSLLVTYRAEHVDHRLAPGIGIRIAEMRHVPLAGDQVRDPVAIHVGAGRRMRLREDYAAGVLRREIVHDHVLDEGYALVGVPLLLPPRDAEAVPFHGADGVDQAVAVDVESADLRASGATLRRPPSAERRRVHLPGAAGARRRLFPPAVRVEVIHTAVAVDVGDPQS